MTNTKNRLSTAIALSAIVLGGSTILTSESHARKGAHSVTSGTSSSTSCQKARFALRSRLTTAARRHCGSSHHSRPTSMSYRIPNSCAKRSNPDRYVVRGSVVFKCR